MSLVASSSYVSQVLPGRIMQSKMAVSRTTRKRPVQRKGAMTTVHLGSAGIEDCSLKVRGLRTGA